MNKTDTHKLKRLWIVALMILSWALCLITVNYPSDHVLPYSPILMYAVYSIMVAFSVASLIMILIKKYSLADVFTIAVQASFFLLFGIIFVKRLLVDYVMFFPLMAISLFVMFVLALTTAVFLIINKKRQGYLLSIITYSLFLMCVIFESYPVAYEQVSEVYGNIKLVYFVAIITASILGIIHSAKSLKEVKENHL